MADKQVVKETRQGPAQNQGGPAAPGAGNVDAAKEAAKARAGAAARLVTELWKKDTQGLFEVTKPPSSAFTPAMFRAKAYSILATAMPNGMTVDAGPQQIEDPQVILEALSGDELHEPYAKALVESTKEISADRGNMLKIGEALDDLMRGGDVTFNVRELMAHYAMLTSDGKKWVKTAPKTEAFKTYVDAGACAEHGALEATHVGAKQRTNAIVQTTAKIGGEKRVGQCRPLKDMLVSGALGAKAEDEKAPDAAQTQAPQLGPDGKPLPPPEDPNQKAADELLAKIEKAVTASKQNKHDEHEIGKKDLERLIQEIDAADPKVKDKLYAKPELMQKLIQLDPAQLKKVVGHLDTVQGLYDACVGVAPQQHNTGPRYEGQAHGFIPDEVFTKIRDYLLARPGKENQGARMRVLQHEQLQSYFIGPLPEDKRKLVFKLVASGTLEPTHVDKLRDAARAGNGQDAARALMKLGNDSNGELQVLRDDHIFQLEIEKVNKDVIVDGFPINPYHLCLTMWGLPVLNTADSGVSERQREVNPDGIYRPLTIEERIALETKLLDPYAKQLRSEIAEWTVDDDDMKTICQSFENAARGFEKQFHVMGQAAGPALADYYNRKYNRDLRTDVNKYVSDGELIECERILGFRGDSSTFGTIGGKIRENGPPQPSDGPPRIIDLAQAMRQTYNDKGVALSQITHELADTIANKWMFEPGGALFFDRWPKCSKDELLGTWRTYKALIESKKIEITRFTNLKPAQIHPIELLSNAVMEKGGDLGGKIQRFFGDGLFTKGSAPEILREMGLTPAAAQERAQAAQKELMASDPMKGIEQAAQQQFGEPAKHLFKGISTLSPMLAPEQIAPVVALYKDNLEMKLASAPDVAGATMGSIEDRPPRSFKAFYRLEYGVDPELHIARVLKSHKDQGKDIAYAAKQFNVEAKVEMGITAPLGEELTIDQRNRHLVRHDFTVAIAKDAANGLWKAIHEGTRFNVIITKLYTDFATEEQRLIRIAFRELSGGLDLQFYIQQKLLQRREGQVTEIGAQGTAKAEGITKEKGIDLGESDINKLETDLTAAQKGTVDCYAMMRSAANTGDIDQMFRLADEAEQEDRAKIQADKPLMDLIRSKCDQVAWTRIYKTLTNQADLTDRLYSRAHGAYDSWNPFDATDEAGMRADIKSYVKKLRRQFDKEVRAEEDKRVKAKQSPRDPDAIDQEITQRVKQACAKLMVNISVRQIIEDELSGDELSDVEGLIINAGETNTQSDVVRSGKDADVIIAGIRNTPPEQRAKLRSDAAYLEKLSQRLPDPNDYRQAMDALMSNRAGDDKLEKVDTAATKKEPREMLRSLVDLDPSELKKLQADPDMQAKLLASFDDPDQRKLAREILATKLQEPPADATDDTRQQISEENRIAFLTQNAKARLRVPLKDKLGWPTMLEQCIEVYKMELEPRVRISVPGGPSGFATHSDSETEADRKLRDDKGKVARTAIWKDLKAEVAGWASVAAKDKPDLTLSEAKTAGDMVRIVEGAVLHTKDPSEERIKNNLGNTVTSQDEYGGEHTTERRNDEDGLKAAIRGASVQILVDEWSNVKHPRTDGRPSLETVYKEYVATKKAVPDEAQATPDQSIELSHKRLAFMDYYIDISDKFESLVLPHVGSSDERKLTKDGGTGKLTERDNKKYNELVDLARERVVNLSKGDNRYIVAKAIGCTDKEDFQLLDTPNRDAITAFQFRDSKFLRSRGTQAGSGWAADKEAQVVDQRMMQYGHEVSEARTNVGPEGTGIITQQEGGKLEERGAEFDRALQAFKDAKAKVAFWMSMIIGVLVTAVLTVLTGGLATGPLAALFFTTAIAGVSAGAKALINEAVLAEDYDLKDEGVKMIGREMLTAFITAGTTMIAQKMVAGVAGMTTLGRQARAAEQVLRTPPPIWQKFLSEASEEVLSETMSGTIDAALIAIDPVHWMHGVAEGRDKALPAAWAELSNVPMRALKGGLTSAVTSGLLSIGKKKELKDSIGHIDHHGKVNLRENFKKVFGDNYERVVATFVEWSVDKIGKGKVDLDAVPGELIEGFLQEVGETNVETHTGTAHERSRSGRAKRELDRNKGKLTAAEEHDFHEMHTEASATDPYVSVQEYVRLRHQMAADAVYAWSAQHPGQTLTEAQVKAFIMWTREAQTADEFQERLKKNPLDVDKVKAAKDTAPPQQDVKKPDQTQLDQTETTTTDKTKTETGKKTGTDVSTTQTTPGAAEAPKVHVVQTVKTVEEGYALMRRLAGGDQGALPAGFEHQGRTDGVEWGLGRKADGSIVLLRGQQGEVDFDKIPGIVALAHSHPAVMDGKPRDLDTVAKAPGGVAIGDLMSDKNSNDLVKFLPSTGDLGYFADNGIGRHVVFTPYVHTGEHKVGNPNGQASPGQRIEIEVRNARMIGRSVIQKHQPAYQAEIIIRDGDGNVLWTGPMFAVKIAAGSMRADQPSLTPNFIEQGQLPLPKPSEDEAPKTKAGEENGDGDITKYATPKSNKAKQEVADAKHNREHAGDEKVRQMADGLKARSVPAANTDSPDLRAFKRDLYHLLHALGVHAKSNEVAVRALTAIDADLAHRVEAFLASVPKNSWGVEEFPKTLADNDPLLVSTDQKATTPDGQDRAAWRKAKVEEILSRDGAAPVTDGRPILYIMGGGGASGKGTLKDMLVEQGTLPEHNVVKIDPDEIKAEIPEYQKIIDEGDSRAAAVVHEESSALSKEVLARAYAAKLNILMDVTLGDPKKGRELLERARAMGYEIRLYGVSVDADTAIQRNLSRAKQTGRYVPPSEQIKAHKGFSRGFEGYADLADEAHLYDTGGSKPTLMADKQEGGNLETKNQGLYDKFQAKGDINLDATSVGDLTDTNKAIATPGVPPSKEQYVDKAMENLAKSSRTAQGTVDTSAGADKAKSMADVSGAQAAETTKGNYAAAVGLLHDNKDRTFKDAAELRGFVEDVARSILSGVVKDGELIRKHEANPSLPYTPVAGLDGAMNQFYGELLHRLRDPNADPISTAAWIEYRINLTDHFFADGCGKISSAIAAWVLMRAGQNLPNVSSRGTTFANAPLKIRGTDEATDQRQEATWEKHYRRQFNSAKTTTKSGGTDGGFNHEAFTAEPELENGPQVGNRALKAQEHFDGTQRQQYQDAIDLADNDGQRVLIDRALAAGHSLAEVTEFAKRMRGMSDAEVMKQFTGAGVFQFYKQTCVVASYQIAIADVDPIYAERLRLHPELVAIEQRDVATSLGGAATERTKLPKAADDVLKNPQVKRAMGQKDFYSTEGQGDETGIETTAMVGTPMHKQLEQATGSQYEVLTGPAFKFTKPGQGSFPNPEDARTRIDAALDQGLPVIIGTLLPWNPIGGGHAQVIIAREVNEQGNVYVVRDPESGTISRIPAELFGTAYKIQSITLPAVSTQQQESTGETKKNGALPTTTGAATEPGKDGSEQKDDAKDARTAAPVKTTTVEAVQPGKDIAAMKDNLYALQGVARELLKAKGIDNPSQSQVDETTYQLNEAIKKGKWQTFEAPFSGQVVKAEDNVDQRLGNIFGEKKIFSQQELRPDNLKLDSYAQQNLQGSHESGMRGMVLAASFINTRHRAEGDFSRAYGDDAWKGFLKATSLLDGIPKGQLLQSLNVELMLKVNELIHAPDTGMKAKLLRFVAMIGRGFKWDKGGELRDGNQFARPDHYSGEEIANLREAGVQVDVLKGSDADGGTAMLHYPDADQVRPTLEKLVADLREELAQPNADPIGAAANFQRKFVALHPFGDSNGRTSRVIMNRILAEYDMPPAIFADQNRDISMSKQEWRDEVAKGVARSKQFIQNPNLKAKDSYLGDMGIKAVDASPNKPINVEGMPFDLGQDGLLYDPVGRPYVVQNNAVIPLSQLEHIMMSRRIMQTRAYKDPTGAAPDQMFDPKATKAATDKLKGVTQETREFYDKVAKDPAAATGVVVRNDASSREADAEYKLAPSPEVGKMLTDLTDLSSLDSTKLLSGSGSGTKLSTVMSRYAQIDLEFWYLEQGLHDTGQKELAEQVRQHRIKLFEMAKAEMAKHKDAARVSNDNPDGFHFKYEKMMYDRSPLRFETFEQAVKELGDKTITIWRGDYSFARIIGMAPNNDIRQPDAKKVADKRWEKGQVTNLYDDLSKLEGSAVGRQYICTTSDLALLTAAFANNVNSQVVNLGSLPDFIKTRLLAWMEPSFPEGTTDADKEASRKEAMARGEKIVPTSEGGKEIRDAFGIPGTIIKVKVIDKAAGKVQITAVRKAFEITLNKQDLLPGIQALGGSFESEQEMHGLESVRPWNIKSTHEADKLKEEFPVNTEAKQTPPAN